ncbi:MAG: universal stress protein [Methylohalobius crimeensis]
MQCTETVVLACIDGSAFTPAVCDYAAWIAQRVEVPLKLLHNLERRDTADRADLSGAIGLGSQEHLLEELTEVEQQRSKLMLQKGKLMLEAARERVVKAGVADPIVSQRHGSLTESLIELEDQIRVLVLGVRGEAHENRPGQLGAQLETIIRSLHRPILVVNAPFTAPRRIMLAYDGSDAAEKAVDMVATSPLYKGLTCHLVCVNKDERTADALLESASNKIARAGGIELITQKLRGKPDQELCDYQAAHDIDLTVMGAFSHTRFRELLLGSFTAKMLLHMKKPLLLLR